MTTVSITVVHMLPTWVCLCFRVTVRKLVERYWSVYLLNSRLFSLQLSKSELPDVCVFCVGFIKNRY